MCCRYAEITIEKCSSFCDSHLKNTVIPVSVVKSIILRKEKILGHVAIRSTARIIRYLARRMQTRIRDPAAFSFSLDPFHLTRIQEGTRYSFFLACFARVYKSYNSSKAIFNVIGTKAITNFCHQNFTDKAYISHPFLTPSPHSLKIVPFCLLPSLSELKLS